MKITGFETIPIRGRSMILKMFTDEGLVGFGEPMNYEHWRPVAAAVDDMAEYLVGRDPLQIEDHWQAMFRSSYSRSMPVLVGASERDRDGDVGRIRQDLLVCRYGNCWAARCVDASVYTRLRVAQHRKNVRRTQRLPLRGVSAR